MQAKPKSLRAIRQLRKREPKLVQGVKQTLFIRGNKTSEPISALMKDLRSLRRVHSAMFNRRHDIHPFEQTQQLQQINKKTDTSLFLFGSHNKKRPNNIVIGRTYEHQVLDMVQLGVVNVSSIKDIIDESQVPYDVQPFVVFQGDLWESDGEFKKMRNLINDFFLMNNRPGAVEIDNALKVVVCWSVTEERKIFLRVFEVGIEGGSKVLEEEGKLIIEELGPNAQFVLRRSRWAGDEEFKKATYVPKLKKKKENKNIRYDSVGNKRGKLYVDRQNLKNMPSKRRKMISKGEKREGGEIIGHTKNQDQFAQ